MKKDVQVHAQSSDGEVLSRSDRAGKWYLGTGDTREQVTIAEAVTLAIFWKGHGGEVFYNLPGGKTFDSRVRQVVGEVSF